MTTPLELADALKRELSFALFSPEREGLLRDCEAALRQAAAPQGREALETEKAEADKYYDYASEFGYQLQNLREVVKDAIDILTERKRGNDARSPGHNARVILETALKAKPPALTPAVAPDGAGEAMTADEIYALCKSTLIGFRGELTEQNIKFICDQISRKVMLAFPPAAALSHNGTRNET